MFDKISCAEFMMVSTVLLTVAVSSGDAGETPSRMPETAAKQKARNHKLENDHIRLVFDYLGRVIEIFNKKAHIHYVQPDGGADPLPAFIIDAYSANQHIYIHDPLLREGGGFCFADPELLFSIQRSGDLHRLAIEPSQPPELILTTQDGMQILTCNSVLDGDIRVTFTVSLPPDSATSEWYIKVNNAADIEPRQYMRVYRVLFPLLSRLCIDGDPEKNYLARPYIQGELIPNPSRYSFTRPNRPQNYINVLTYPGWASMPWMDLYAEDADSVNGLYFSSYDPTYQQLDMETVPNAEAGTIAMGMRTLAFLEPGQQWRSQKFVVELHSGDWHWAADRYRSDSAEWFIEPDVPEWVRYTHGWFGSGGPNYRFSELPEMLEDARWLGLNYLQCWSEMLENVGPEKSRKPYYCFFLPDPERGGESEMIKGVRSVREQGGHIGFYSNFWTWDADSGRCLEQWKQDIPPDVEIPYWQEFKRYMSVFPDGHMEAGDFLEGYAGSCPGAEGWRDYLKFWIVDKYVKQYGVDAWYLDSFPVTMFGAARACFSQHHGEQSPHGVGQWLLEFVKMLRERTGDTVQLAITCESVNDLFMQYNSHALGLELIDGITIYPKPEIYTYTFPHHPIFSGSCNGAGSGLKYYYPDVGDRGSRQDTLNRVFLMGYRFDILGHKLNRDNPDMIYIRDLITLRHNIKGELYDSSFRDEIGLGELPQNVWAKVFRQDEGRSLTIAFIDRRESKDAMTLMVDTARLDVGRMNKATLYTLDGRKTELKIAARTHGVLVMEIPAREGDAAAVIIQKEPQGLKVDPEGRFIIRNDGTPFFWLGDTAWFILRLTNDEIRYYLSNRVEKGFTGIQVDLNPYAWTNLMAPGECENPFLNDNIDTPNDRYWQRVDWMVDEVARYGLYALLTPMWGKHYPRYVGIDTAKAYELGKWLGSRYRDRTHVMWFVSGEYDSINGYRPITLEQKKLLNAVAQGLEDGHGGNQLMTIHPGARRTSSADFHNEDWLDFNMLQSGHFDDAGKWDSPETYTLITNDYNRTPTKPVLEGEPAYEDMIDGYFRGPRDGSGIRMGADVMRRKAYWSVFAGGFGHTYGHSDVQIFWSPGKPREVANRNHWRDALEAPGAGQMRHLRSLIESRAFLNRVPAQSVLASAAGSGKDHVRATRASDGSYAMVYIPTGGEVTVEMSKITGAKVKASWFDPRTGTYTAIGDYSSNGTQVFDPPGAAAIGNDWVLVLDAKAEFETEN